jgi:hypothetical protein
MLAAGSRQCGSVREETNLDFSPLATLSDYYDNDDGGYDVPGLPS